MIDSDAPGADSGIDGGTGEDAPAADTGGEAGGCGCSTPAAGGFWPALLALLLLLARRRRY
ncbi:MAG: hypothetical protein DRI34_01660 [Deltaproteobacteria bacterium]|nr:MAG: hypothetical protein DRI34_01660 [Deltaproteobacteria bacterium]